MFFAEIFKGEGFYVNTGHAGATLKILLFACGTTTKGKMQHLGHLVERTKRSRNIFFNLPKFTCQRRLLKTEVNCAISKRSATYNDNDGIQEKWLCEDFSYSVGLDEVV